MKKIALLADLTKYKLSLAVTLSAATGYFISGNGIQSSFVALVSGIFLLTSGAAALNQFTERGSDALMERTRNRPIPSYRIDPLHALYISIFLIAAGLIILSFSGIIPVLLAALAIILYNLAYTKLKKITVLSVVPGALVGVLPPLIGYTSAGGALHSGEIIIFSSFMFLWQLPHFWIILIRFREDYRRAGFSTFRAGFSELQIKMLVFFWVSVTTSMLIVFSVRELVFSWLLNSMLIILNLIFILIFYSSLFGKNENRSIMSAFILINSFSLLVMILFILNSLLR
ncbi:MAG: protoheme IX farnesyltransferase [Bacteroidales bacterium]|jgi:protoheme IX farnesyltransferase